MSADSPITSREEDQVGRAGFANSIATAARSLAPWADMRTRPRWRVRLLQLQAGWELLWAQRLRRDLDPIYQLVACRRGRHRDAHLLADDLVGSPLADDYPELAVCEICGRAIEWPNGRPRIGAGRCSGEWTAT